MIKIFTNEQAKELDKYTIQNEPISSVDLIERAATLFMHEFCRRYSKQSRIFIFAGQGNNGADALAIARLLTDESYKVETYLFNPTENLSPECQTNKAYLLEEFPDIPFHEIIDDFEPPQLTERDIIIDGLFGTGLNRPLTGGFAAMVDYINQSGSTIVSIDIPSGLFGEDNSENNPDAIIRANLTLTFGSPKLAFFLPENAPYTGDWKVLDIGLLPEIVARTQTPYHLMMEDDIANLIEPRNKFAHKGMFGHALLVAGSRGKTGAALLAAQSCLRSGTGLLTVHLPQCGETVLQTAIPEAMLSIDPHKDHFTMIPEIQSYSAVGIGPGLGQHTDSVIGMEDLLKSSSKPLVIDADGINILAANKPLLSYVPPRSILTPHPKEFDRIAGGSTNTFERLQKATSFATEYKVILVLKGAYTAICLPEGGIYFNPTGNPGMATAGSGDVLTGIILGLLAQGFDSNTAAILGVFLHGTAGDLAAAMDSEESLLASDITAMLGKAYKQLR
ncbi:NAD(P)H-hydrate dehydratase [Parabacteroides sp. PF5-9]|uniref:NAD(P)H-hydrate dehydratase n=1 Tax=Parabacteroides sp. PF5-9 TaxID=1742404 RepID=UPI002476949C|nr:NAD(P)H-hydrate dehydratase [Parabacteroides sp. PF5-9]MDH6356230.1 hydroxyethylthiazole kinase-like uncharacterized protein yjeF [Parabacteroides sp. PF5-9]